MSVTLELSPESEAALKAQAQALGLTVEQLLLELAGERVLRTSIAHLQQTNPQEWVASSMNGLIATIRICRFYPKKV